MGPVPIFSASRGLACSRCTHLDERNDEQVRGLCGAIPGVSLPFRLMSGRPSVPSLPVLLPCGSETVFLNLYAVGYFGPDHWLRRTALCIIEALTAFLTAPHEMPGELPSQGCK